MKKAITVIFLFVSVFGFSQAKNKGSIAMPLGDSSKIIHQDFTEEQMVDLYQLLQIAIRSDLIWNSDQVTTRGAKMISSFGDSLIRVYANQSNKWHPAPVPKTDSTGKK